jgi:hypothetical protein
MVFPRRVSLTGEDLITFLCVVLIFLNKIYVQSMYTKYIKNLILDPQSGVKGVPGWLAEMASVFVWPIALIANYQDCDRSFVLDEISCIPYHDE